MIGTASNQTPNMQRKLILAAFATPFALATGTGGFTHALPVESTGNSMFVVGTPMPTKEQIVKARFVKNLELLMQEFRINKIQMARLMLVSRQSVHNWLEGSVDSVKEANQQRLDTIRTSLLEFIDKSFRSDLGTLLNRRLDKKVSDFENLISQDDVSSQKLEPILRSFNFKLAGISKSERLSAALSHKKPLI